MQGTKKYLNIIRLYNIKRSNIPTTFDKSSNVPVSIIYSTKIQFRGGKFPIRYIIIPRFRGRCAAATRGTYHWPAANDGRGGDRFK